MSYTAHLDRLATFAQHGQPKDYGGSDMMRADLESLLKSLTGAQPAPAAPSVPETLTCTCNTYPHTAWCYPLASALHLGAPAAQPADSAMEVLLEALAALEESRDDVLKVLNGLMHGKGYPSYDHRIKAYTEQLARHDAAIDRARALTAASKERSKTHE
jgi:hypothetical protein